MIYDPVTTFAIYLIAILGIFTLCAVIADLWLAHTERKLRDQARAEARAERMIGERSSRIEWH
jgi:predicted outer membrane lipoprotein